MSASPIIPVNAPAITDAEIAGVTRAVAAGHVSSLAPEVAEFEERWAAYCGRRHGVAVSSGTTALELAVACLDLQPGDEVLMPSFTIISCALAAVRCGAVPVLVDADPRTGCIDASLLESRVGPRTRAIMPVHMYGHPADMDAVMDVARRHGLSVIEDAAQAHGAEYRSGADGEARWLRCGSFGAMSCFSFYANKLVTTGEGGMLLTDDDALAARARLLRNLAFKPGRRFEHEELGFNFRMTGMQAALGMAQVGRMQDIVERKRALALRYSRGLGDIAHLSLPREEEWARSVFWACGIVLSARSGMDAAALAAHLLNLGVETRPYFKGLHEQPALARWGLGERGAFPVTEMLSRQGLYLPSGIGLSAEDADRVIAAVRQAFE